MKWVVRIAVLQCCEVLTGFEPVCAVLQTAP
jgi:hypothetical protein